MPGLSVASVSETGWTESQGTFPLTVRCLVLLSYGRIVEDGNFHVTGSELILCFQKPSKTQTPISSLKLLGR